MLTLGILCSGQLGLETLEKIFLKYSVACVLTDRKSEAIIEFAKRNKIPFYAGNPRKGKGYDFIQKYPIDILISINYLFLIDSDIIGHASKLSFNIHGSLLPKYRGRTPHVWAIINGEDKAGITAHVIDEGCDTGKIIRQLEVPIGEYDTGADILRKYAELYYPLIREVIKEIETGAIELKVQNEEEATYFGKRTPEDGLIEWRWPGKKIRNWVRAQADPYPGAFTFLGAQKIIIDKVQIRIQSFTAAHLVGEILETNPKVIVKTGDGVAILENTRPKKLNFNIGDVFQNENRE